jgi:hypothetical protein
MIFVLTNEVYAQSSAALINSISTQPCKVDDVRSQLTPVRDLASVGEGHEAMELIKPCVNAANCGHGI